jgi:hypothetical protein
MVASALPRPFASRAFGAEPYSSRLFLALLA